MTDTTHDEISQAMRNGDEMSRYAQYPHEYAVNKLTRPWSDVLSPKESGTGRYQPVDHQPLLTMLEEAVRASLGRTAAGRSPASERSLIDMKAFTLLERIQDGSGAWLVEWGVRPPKDVRDRVVQLADTLTTLHRTQRIEQTLFERVSGMFDRWVREIWELLDPPKVKDLIGSCPNCGEEKYTLPDGGRVPALVAYWWKGLRPEAKCQCCGERWEDEKGLIALGYHLKANMDEETLREMGAMA